MAPDPEPCCLPLPGMAAQPQSLQPGDFYFTPEGYMVFTEQYHLRRGTCCKSGCRHCPWGFRKPGDAPPDADPPPTDRPG